MREYQVRICERLGVKFPGPTRQTRRFRDVRVTSAQPSDSGSRIDPSQPTLRAIRDTPYAVPIAAGLYMCGP